jgi:hypothetical protein
MSADKQAQLDLADELRRIEEEREQVVEANEERVNRRGFIIFATRPGGDPDAAGYREVFATEARTAADAMRKVRPLARGRRLRAYLSTGRYSDELPNARWVA